MIMQVVYIMGMWSVLSDRKFIEMPCLVQYQRYVLTKENAWRMFKLRLYDYMNNLKVMQTLKCYSCIGTGFVFAEKIYLFTSSGDREKTVQSIALTRKVIRMHAVI